jgi:hypothetical protein
MIINVQISLCIREDIKKKDDDGDDDGDDDKDV